MIIIPITIVCRIVTVSGGVMLKRIIAGIAIQIPIMIVCRTVIGFGAD